MKYVIAIDFGSTFTKIVIIDREQKKVIHSDKTPSTVGTDAAIGMNRCFAIARNIIGEEEFSMAMKIASSSAAGGLRMAVIGLTRSLSLMAGESAALGAGAKVVANYMGKLRDEDIADLEQNKAERHLRGGDATRCCTMRRRSQSHRSVFRSSTAAIRTLPEISADS